MTPIEDLWTINMPNDIGRRDFLKQGAILGAVTATGLPVVAEGAMIAEPASPTLAPNEIAALADRQLDSRDFCLSVYDSITPALAFSATTPAAARAWQKRARPKLIDRLGGFPATRAPLRAEVLETRDLGTYTREKIVFQTRDRLSAIGFLLLPKERPRPLPAIVALPGHGRGVADIIGLAADGSQQPRDTPGYAHQYAVQCAEHGYATFALEQLGFGYRRDEATRQSGPTTDSCRPAATSALLLGQTMAAWRTWDAMRTIDYLVSRPEVDATRIATLGASGGGTTSLLTAALDDRVRVGVVSAYFNTFRDSIVSISHCPDNYVPGLLHDMEMSDIAGLVAPRALFVESGRNDRIFPIAGSMTAAEHARGIYAAFGAPDRFGYAIHEGAHEFDGVAAFGFLERTLSGAT